MSLPQIPSTAGQSKSVVLIRRILQELRSLRIVSSPDIMVNKGPDGTSIKIRAGVGQGGSSIPRWG